MSKKPNDNRLEKLEKTLYRDSKTTESARATIAADSVDAPQEWESHDEKDMGKKKVRDKSSLLFKLLIVSAIFFVISSGIALYRIFVSPNIISPENIDILVQGPVSTGGGDELSLQVLVTNENSVPLQSADLIIDYPDGARSPGDLSELKKNRLSLGVVPSGIPVTKTLKMVLFGEENSEKTISFKLEYRVSGSSGTFVKNQQYTVAISNAPTTLSVDIPPEVNSGQRIAIPISARSNSTNVIEDFMIIADYPFGFEFESAQPKPTFDNNMWYVGDLEPSEEFEITIFGTVTGEIAGQRSFKVRAGIQDKEDTRLLAVVYNALTEIVDIERPFVGIDLLLNNKNTEEVAADGNAKVVGEIRWVNNLPTRILNGVIEVRLNGELLNEESVLPNKGFYRSLDNTILWDQTTDRILEVLEPGEVGITRFSFFTHTLEGTQGARFRRPTIDVDLTFKGTRVSEGFSGDPVEVSLSRTIKINTHAQLVSHGLRESGPFVNTGPIPPRVDQETLYTISWSVINSSNDISGAEIRATMPTYMRWVGVHAPGSENITYNDVTGEIVWNVGSIPAGVGVTRPAQQIQFQVGLTPSLSQLGGSPTLISEATLTGRDTFTKQIVGSTESGVTSGLRNSPDYKGVSSGRVTQ